jgi:hypothetical protein
MSDTPKKKGGLKKWIFRGVLVVGGLVVVGGVVGRIMAPGIIRGQIEAQGSKILGTPVTCADVDLSLLGGGVTLSGITIANIPGFEAKNLFELQEVAVNVSLMSLLGSTITVEEIRVNGPKVALETNKEGKRNLQELLAQIKAAQAQTAEEAPAEPAPAAEPSATPGILLSRLTLDSMSVQFIDQFAHTEGPLRHSVNLGALEVSDLLVPPSDAKEASQVMTLALRDFALSVSDRFSEPKFLSFKETVVKIDTAKLMASLAGPTRLTDIPLVTNDSTTVVLETLRENKDDSTPENLREFVLVAQNATSAEPAKTLAQLDEEARKKAEEAKQKAEEPAASEPAPSDAPAEGKSAEPADRVTLAALQVKNFTFRNINKPDPSKDLLVASTEVDLKDVKFPHVDGNISELVLRTRPIDAESKVSLKARGEFLAAMDGKRVDVTSEITNQQLAGLPSIEAGRLNSTLTMVLDQKRAKGSLKLGTQGFRFAPVEKEGKSLGGVLSGIGQGATQKSVELALAGHEKSGAPPIEVPFDYHLDKVTVTEVFTNLMKTLASNMTNVLTPEMGEAGKKAGEVLQGAGKEAGKALEGAGDKLKDGVKDAEGALKGLFGGKKKESE